MRSTIIVAALLAAVGCNKSDSAASENRADDTTRVAADNTAKNERDQHADTVTPGDQAENAADRTITQQIRQGVVKGDDISMSGKNVKIITVDGVVTLRGPVPNAKEKSDIAALAKQVEGVKRVDNQLEVASN